MAIKKPNELVAQKQHYNVIVAGFPGIGKTQLGFSAPKPLLINADKGVMRVPAVYRKDIDDVETYEELLQDLDSNDLSEYESIVIDTGGRLLDMMKGWAIRKEPKNGQFDGNLTLKGYGVVGAEFMRFINHIKYDLNKHCIVLFHAKEEKDGDVTKLRLLIEGQSKDNVWQPMDIGGFIEMRGNDRYINFTNNERHFAKGSFGVKGAYKIPNLDNGGENNFLTKLFEIMDKYIETDSKSAEEQKSKYVAIMEKIKPLIDTMCGENIEEVQNAIKTAEHCLTTEVELKALFKARLAEIGYKYDVVSTKYVKIED